MVTYLQSMLSVVPGLSTIDLPVKEKGLNKSEALSKFTYNDTGFVWIEISSHKLYFSMHDSDGNVLYEYTKTR